MKKTTKVVYAGRNGDALGGKIIQEERKEREEGRKEGGRVVGREEVGKKEGNEGREEGGRKGEGSLIYEFLLFPVITGGEHQRQLGLSGERRDRK